MKILITFLFLVIINAVQSTIILDDVETEWIRFKDSYGKVYKSVTEEHLRKYVFLNNYNLIKTHNTLYQEGNTSYFLKINKFADMTSQERKITSRGLKVPKAADFEVNQYVPDPNVEIPDSVDWREKDAVTEVKDQKSCGSCWAFSATGSLETQYFLKTGKLVSISEQNLVDCSRNDDNIGCDGGFPNSAFKYIWTNDGIDSEESYPYTAVDGDCKYTIDSNVTSVRGYSSIEPGNEDNLKAAVAQAGTVSVGIDASEGEFSFYGGGVYYNEKCKDGAVDPVNDLDHGVLVVGYGNLDGQDYWLVKNSWSAFWGEDGYIKMSRNRDNNCGITSLASFPLLY